ncbi:MAG: MFS transporter [Jatrophihabitans sp.]|uniref:MFS transporter n=1 Tax=Jatrophihabitans sp. TaxID=1932789 RepID=UPI003F7DFED1
MGRTVTTLEAPSRPAATPPGARPDRRWWILAVLGIAQLMVVLDATIVNIALPHAQADLGFGNADRQWVVTAYSLAFGSRLADLFGRKRVFLVGVVGFALASALGGAATGFTMLVIARAIQGGFGAVLAPAALSLLTTTFVHPDERNKAFGIFGGIAGAGASMGLLLGGFLTEYLDWRWTMYVNLIFAVVAAVGGFVLLTHTRAEARPRLDLVGTVLVSAGMFAIVYGFSHVATLAAEGHTGASGWTDGQTIGFLVAGVVLLLAFLVVQRRIANPLLPLRILTDRNRGGALMAMFLSAIGMFGVFLFLTYYLETTLGFSAVKTGVAFLPMTALIVVVAGVGNTVLVRKYSPRLLVTTGLLLNAVAMVLFTRIDVHSGYASTVLPPLLVLAVGLGLTFAPSFSLATLGVEGRDSGVASAAINVAQQIGGSIGTAVLNSIATSAVATYIASHAAAAGGVTPALQEQAAVHSYTVAFWVGAVVFVVAAVVVGPLLRPGLPDFSANENMDEPVALHA